MKYLLVFVCLAGFIQPVTAIQYYVGLSGNNRNNGSLNFPFLTIGKAVSVVKEGDVVNIADGVYCESVVLNVSGKPSAYITFKSINKWGAKIVSSGVLNGFDINGDYVKIDGIDLTNPDGHGFNCEKAHHVQILNCHPHHYGNSGIAGGYSDFYIFEGNTCNNNAILDWYSGISIYEPKSIGDASPGFHIIIRNNISSINFAFYFRHTDGNGIIVDDWNYTQNPGTPYPFTGLIENNLCYYNGRAGIKSSWSSNVTVRNNTVYKNNTDNLDTGTYRGDLYFQQARNCILMNNIAWADPAINPYNTAMMDKGAYTTGASAANIWANNIFYGGTAGQSSKFIGDSSSPTLIANQDGVNPLLINPPTNGTGDFRLLYGSPAIDAGTATYGVTADNKDLQGTTRILGSAINLGCYEGTGIIIPVAGVSITSSSVSVNVNGTRQLNTNIIPSNANSKTVNWLSVNPAIASVNNNGVVTGVAIGVVKIFATTTEGRFVDSVFITVISDPAAPLSGNPLINKIPASLSTVGKAGWKQVKIMPFGESTTAAWQSYRKGLYDSLKAHQYNFDFIGSLHEDATDWDGDHQGMSGNTFRQLTDWINTNYQTYPADIILLMEGTNNCGWSFTPGVPVINGLDTLLDAITTKLPDAIVLVAAISPMAQSAYYHQFNLNTPVGVAASNVIEYNNAIPNLIEKKYAAGKKIYFVDTRNTMHMTDISDDGIHPLQSGYDKLAVSWFKAVLPFLKKKQKEIKNITDLNFYWNLLNKPC